MMIDSIMLVVFVIKVLREQHGLLLVVRHNEVSFLTVLAVCTFPFFERELATCLQILLVLGMLAWCASHTKRC